jgi:Copine/C2 domain
VGKNAVKVGKNTVGVVGNLPGNAIDVAGLTVKGVTNLPGNAIHLATLAARRLQRSDAAEATAWKTRVTSRVTKVELEISCRNLRRKDAFAESDAFAVLWKVPSGYGSETAIVKPGDDSIGQSNHSASLTTSPTKRPRINSLPGKVEKEVGRTEVVKGNRNPEFRQTFVLDFKFQEEQTYVLRIYDRDLEFCPDLKEHDFLGGAVFTLGELMGSGRRTIRRPLRSKGSDGKKSMLYIQGTEVNSTRSVMEFRFSAEDLKEKDKVIDSDPDLYFHLSKLNMDDHTWQPVYKSEVVLLNDKPTWARARIPLPEICDDNIHNPLKIEFWNYVRGGHDEPVGYVETTCQNLVAEAERGIPVYDVWHDKKRTFGRTKTTKHGKLKVLRSELKPVPTILEFIAGGLKLDVTVAVDCSVYNFDSVTEKSLHSRTSATRLNDYEMAIAKIGEVLGPYVNKEQFNIWGFGATLQGEDTALFPMGHGDGPAIGVSGMLEAYEKTFTEHPRYMEPAANSSIVPLIQTAMYEAIQKLEVEQSYSVLCILTAGKIINDLDATIDMVCTAAEDAPISIAIIGIGDNEGDFEDIKLLLANGGKLRHSNGVPIARDIVSFAAFHKEWLGNAAGKVVAEALKEIPEQLVEYFTDNGIKPRPAVEEMSASSNSKSSGERSSRRRRDVQSRTKKASVSPMRGSSRRRAVDGLR